MAFAQKNILVIGAGISGLTCAHELVSAGYKVTIVYEKDASLTPSVVAGALWEWPPAVCGHHNDSRSLQRSKPWCFESYKRFRQLSTIPQSGVNMENAYFYFFQPVNSSEFELSKMKEIREHVDGFVHDSTLIEKNRINDSFGLQDAYSFVAPVINTPVYTNWLKNNLESKGVVFQRKQISSDLSSWSELLEENDAEALVNCSGLGARELGDDQVYPLRGALVRVKVNQQTRIQGAHCIAHDHGKPQQNMIYLVRRGDVLLLGGIAEPNQWEESISAEDAIARGILERCHKFMPDLTQFSIDEDHPILVGLRPARNGNVRLEREEKLPVVHNYGHGGSGFSMSWGCAKEVATMV